MQIASRRGRLAPDLTAVLDQLQPLVYAGGASAPDDLPDHVRAASAVRRFGSRLLVVQDDTNALALVPAAGGPAQAVVLPAGPDGRRVFDDARGNKHLKLDLEACAALGDGRLVMFGSGSRAARKTVVLFDEHAEPTLIPAPRFYVGLRAVPAFAGSELNVEGALVVGDDLLLFQRGNGATRAGIAPVNAMGAVDLAAFLAWLDGDHARAPPGLHAITQLDFGAVAGCAFSVTDAALAPDGRIVLLACAERSADAVSDGPVAGCRFAWFDGRVLEMTDVLDPTGARCLLKLEGIEPRPAAQTEFDVVIDMDRHDQPAQRAPDGDRHGVTGRGAKPRHASVIVSSRRRQAPVIRASYLGLHPRHTRLCRAPSPREIADAATPQLVRKPALALLRHRATPLLA